jgi:hypothetical protein
MPDFEGQDASDDSDEAGGNDSDSNDDGNFDGKGGDEDCDDDDDMVTTTISPRLLPRIPKMTTRLSSFQKRRAEAKIRSSVC